MSNTGLRCSKSSSPRKRGPSAFGRTTLGSRLCGNDEHPTARNAPIATVLLALCLVAQPLAAATLRFASGFDPQSLDPHALALQYQTRVVSQIYDSLVSRDRNFAIEPALAVSWQQLEPTRWRFKLRAGVKFHDGAPFTADDVVFSIQRALHKLSQRSFQLRGVIEARKVDGLTVDFLLSAPDAVLP